MIEMLQSITFSMVTYFLKHIVFLKIFNENTIIFELFWFHKGGINKFKKLSFVIKMI